MVPKNQLRVMDRRGCNFCIEKFGLSQCMESEEKSEKETTS